MYLWKTEGSLSLFVCVCYVISKNELCHVSCVLCFVLCDLCYVIWSLKARYVWHRLLMCPLCDLICALCYVLCALWSVFCDLISKSHTGNCVIRNGHIRKARYEWLNCNGHIRNARYQWPTTQCTCLNVYNRQNVTYWILPSQACDLSITKSSMSEYYQSPITMSEFTTSYITNGFKNHQSTSYITNGFKNHQSTYKVNKKRLNFHNTYIKLALWTLMVS